MFDQMFVVVQNLSNTIKHNQTREKMFGLKTMFDRQIFSAWTVLRNNHSNITLSSLTSNFRVFFDSFCFW